MNHQGNSVIHYKYLAKFALLFFTSLLSSLAGAVVEVSIAAGYLDNPDFQINSDPLAEESDILTETAVWVLLDRDAEIIDLNLNYTLLSRSYKDDILSDRIDIAGSGEIIWKIVPEYFSWGLTNSRSLEKADFVLSDSSDNSEIINVTETGPKFQAPVGLTNQVSLELNYALANYDESSVGDQIRQAADVQFLHNINNRFNLAVNADYLDINFDDDSSLDYQKNIFSIAGIYTKPTYNFSIEIGEEQFKRELTGSESDLYFNFSVGYQPNSNSQFSFEYAESIEDRFSVLLEANRSVVGIVNLPAGQGFSGSTGGPDVANIFELRETKFSYVYTTDNLSSVSLYFNSDDREVKDTGETEKVKALTLEYIYAVSLNFRLSIYGTLVQNNFSEDDRTQDQDAFGLRAIFQVNTRLGLQLSFDELERSGNYLEDNFKGWEVKLAAIFRLQQ